jgi:drug/metabolite transporter (DMT)-like permease
MALEVPTPEPLPPLPPLGAARPSSQLISVALLVVSVSFAVAGQLTLKAGMERVGRIGAAQVAAPMETIAKALREPRLWLGLFLFGVSALFWLVVLSRVDLSLAYPMVGMTYIIVVALARFLLHEQIPPLRWIGVVVVACGIALIGLSFRHTTG